jgi:hypothetical protein
VSVATEIPPCGERWSKGIPFDVRFYKEFIKPNYLNRKLEEGAPSRYLQEPFQKFLREIRKYFTCEGRFDRIHSNHIRFLMHFIGRRSLNIPFFLHRSLQEMEDNIRAKTNQPNKKLSHASLINLLIVEELRRLGNNFDSFILIVWIPKDPKRYYHLLVEKGTSHRTKRELERATKEGKKLEALSSQQSIPRKRGRPRKDKEIGEAQVSSDPCTNLVNEYLLMHAIWMEPVKGPSRETCGRRRRTNTEGTNIRELSQ